jgi:hypothetical protein
MMRRDRFVRMVTPCVVCEVPVTNYTLLVSARRLLRKAAWQIRPDLVSVLITLQAGPLAQNERPTFEHLSLAHHLNDRNKPCEIRGVAEINLEDNVL